MWEVEDRGFLPNEDPIKLIKNPTEESTYSYIWVDRLGMNLAEYLRDRKVREELVCELRGTKMKLIEGMAEKTESMETVERLMCLYSYFASAYVYATDENPATRLPVEIARPLATLAKRCGRHPILSYASYCLYNWERIETDKPVELGNIQLLQKFVHTDIDGSVDEDWFILVHVDIEAKAAKGIRAIKRAQAEQDPQEVKACLADMAESLWEMNRTMDRMPEYCRPDYYFRKVRPYIFSFENMKYEGVFDDLMTFRGETGAQSSVVPAFQIALGVVHKDSKLTQHLDIMREYMPKPHRLFLAHLEKQPPIREFVLANLELKDAYNECVNQLAKFRKTHLQYAVEYIQKKVENPKGTGGTPYIPWLSQLAEETKAFLM